MKDVDGILNTIVITFLICIVCSIFVSASYVGLKPLQEKNKLLDKRENILKIAGLYVKGKDVNKQFKSIQSRAVILKTGEFTDKVNTETFDERKAAKNPKENIILTPDKDQARIKKVSKIQIIYLVYRNNKLTRLILPIHGLGLWSTLYGFIALKGDLKTIQGLGFYEHGETPGLGGEVDNPRWKKLWQGKIAYDENGNRVIHVIKGRVNPNNPAAAYTVDGLSGATMTTRGVNNLVQFWLSENGFLPLINKLKAQNYNREDNVQ